LATSITFDADYIIVGDTYKNVSVLKVCDKEENEAEKLAQEGDMINIKKIMGNRIDSHIVSAHSLNKPNPNRVVMPG
jgi:hypothetical protein